MDKKKKSALLLAYRQFMETGLRSESKAPLDQLVDERVMGFGTTVDEKILGIKGFKKLLDIQKKQSRGLDMKWKIKPFSQTITPDENTAVFADDLYLSVVAGKEKLNMYMRFSVVLNYSGNRWKVIHWHGSKPENVASEKDTFGVETWKEKAEALEKLVAERTLDLLGKNRELEVESSLERVRAVAMGMQEPADMLGMCQVISEELMSLGVGTIRNIQTAIIDKNNETYQNYEYFRQAGKSLVTAVAYKKHPVINAFVKRMLKDPEGFFTRILKGEELKNWIQYQGKEGQFVDPASKKASSLHYYFYSIGPGALGISTYAPLSRESISLFKRFRNVFQLAYARFIDIELALAQAFEAKIEASLEKVRAQALGMRKPEELPDVCEVLFKELQALGFTELRNAMVNIHNDEKRTFVNYDYSDEIGKSITPLFYDIHPVIKKQIRQIRIANDAFSETVFKGKDLASWKAFRKSRGEKEDKRIKNSTALYYYFYSTGTGSIGISAFSQMAREKQEVLKRFRNVFAFAYRRYLDVAQAEAQAREALIELALERVRAGAMAMRHSDELGQLIFVLYQELTKLDAKLDRCFIMIVHPENQGITWWMAGQEGLLAENGFFIQNNQHASHLWYLDCWRKRRKRWQYLLEGKEKRDWDRFGFAKTELTRLPEPVKKFMAGVKKIQLSGSSDQFGSLVTGSFEPLPEEHQEIINRFAVAFNQAYIRFLDLQKAEAQAREAQIEAALERVRSKTMAMHNSEDVGDTVATMFDELVKLDVHTNRCGILIFDEDQWQAEVWTAKSNPAGKATLIIGQLDLTMHPLLRGIYQAWKNRVPVFKYAMSGDDLSAYYRAINNTRYYPTRFDLTALPDKEIHTDFYFAEGCIFAFTPDPVTDEADSVFKRFANVFSQTYRRYLDLQKAEAQAREAQIEASLERVRSRAMAMHSSAELTEVALELRKQMGRLGQKDLEVCAIHLYDDTHSFESWSAMKVPGSANEILQTQARFPNKGIRIVDELIKNYNEGEKDYVIVNEGVKSVEWFSVLKEYAPELHASILRAVGDMPLKKLKSNWSVADFSGGALVMVTYGEPDPASRNLLRRSANVFEQAYIRFLDLKKAETQAREAQVEASLERVRSRTMAMHKSEDLSETSVVLFNELKKLGIQTSRSGFGIYDEANQAIQLWLTTVSGQLSDQNVLGSIPFQAHYAIHENYTAWKENKPMRVHTFSGSEVKDYYQKIGKYLSIASQKKYPVKLVFSVFFFSAGSLNVMTEEPLTEDEIKIMLRFSNVFGLTYRRFLDLQKAEAQAREAQIEAALERVRSRSMAMHKSDELLEAGEILFSEMQKLGIESLTAGFVLMDKEEKNGLNYTPDPSTKKIMSLPVIIPHNETIHMQRVVENWKKGTSHYVVEMDEQETIQHQTFIAERSTNFTLNAEQLIAISPARLFLHNFYFKEGYLLIVGGARLSAEQIDIMLRFAKVFQQTYTRFLDLQKAEAQAREAEIELGLERVRARAMAMQKSDELSALVDTLFKELTKLDFALNWCIINIIDEPSLTNMVWAANPETNKPPESYLMKFEDYPFHHSMLKGYRERKTKHVYVIEGKEKTTYDNYLFNETEWRRVPKAAQDASRAMKRYVATFSFSNFGGLQTVGEEYLSEENLDILSRFGKVFDLTYTRFNDLQKAEAQAKEAQIEAALERVRSRSIGMQKSEELKDVIKVVYDQLVHLNIKLDHAGFVVDYQPKADWHFWIADNQEIPSRITHPYFESVWATQFNNAKEKGEELFITYLNFEEKNRFYNELLSYVPGLPQASKDFYLNCPALAASTVLLENVGLYIENFEGIPYSDDENIILMRFGKVFQQTYTRFLDLQKAEAQTIEAQIEAALERVRSRTLAMQRSDELAETAAVLFQQLIALGIEPNRLYISIINSEQGETEFWITDEEGRKVSTAFTVKMQENATFLKMYEGWKQQQKSLVIDMQGEELQNYFRHLTSLGVPFKGGLEQKRRVQEIAYFSKGFIGMASPEEQPAETLELLERFAAVFNLTFTRFNDLKIAEAHARQAELDLIAIKEAKQKAEEALTVLQATQKQLVQSEKMASLGELTAGIAHEIQNPLNFVNNFSEVSKELLDEMREAIEKGDAEEAKEIMNDVVQNLEKINHHGKRADGIVKGMLQHSRSSSGVKELTDINALADEYLRLAYHGLRAKDKSFNAMLKTEFDDTIGKINVIPQDIGRVILNLITNAFYAVDEKKKGQPDNYEPAVTVTTGKLNTSSGEAGVMITVKDNGNGVPQQVIDKIFQPFFTTKPTGQGTGLGLSLSYDIVKTHGGELRVETKEGEGSSFILELPIL